SHFFIKLAFAAPASGLPFLSTAFGSQASFVHFVMKLLSAAPARGLPSLPTALLDPIAKTGAWVKRMLQGHLNYFAVSGNHPSLWWFLNKVKRLWLASLKRRSQTARLSWERFIRLVDRFFPPIRTLHPLPCHRFDAKTRGRSPVR